MAEVTYVRADGERRTLDVPEGTSLMTGAVSHQLDGIVGECGGQMMCATCHVYVEPRFFGQLAAPSDDEDAMLDTTACPRLPNSRLSCQLIASGALDGIVVHTPATQLLISNSTNGRNGPMRQPPGRAQRRGGGERKPREERWSELIEVATDVFYAKGYDAASLQDIADRLGMLKGSLYYYIQSKEDLLYDVIKTVHEEGLANIESLAAGEGDALERLRGVIVGHIDHECRNMTKTAVFLHELQALSPERQAEIIGDEHAYRRVFVALIEAGQRDGLIRPEVNPKLAALSILGSVNWVYRWFRPGGEFTARQIGEQFADLALRGIATPDALAHLAPSPPAAEHPVSPTAGKAAPVKPAPVKPAPGGATPVKPAAGGAAPAKTGAGARPSRSRARTA